MVRRVRLKKGGRAIKNLALWMLLILLAVSGCRIAKEEEAGKEKDRRESMEFWQESEVFAESSIFGEKAESKQKEFAEKESQEDSEIEEHIHVYRKESIAATCTEKGYTRYICACGKEMRKNIVEALGHSYGPWIRMVEPTYLIEGREERVCEICGDKETRSMERLTDFAQKGDEKEIADQVILYINQNRDIPAIKLPGLTKVAEYRSRQLVKDFSHSQKASQEAWTACQYGEYTETEITRWDEETQSIIHTGEIWKGYLFNGGMEAIGYLGGYKGSINALAKEFADDCRNSPEHWSYIGSSAYSYIAVGITQDGEDHWYCCVYVSETNRYG